LTRLVPVLALALAACLIAAGGVLGYIALIALRRNEGVFLPAGYVAIACLAAGVLVCRTALRW
jgi:hypothetical protein